MVAPLLDPSFRYHSAEESRKPGYLAHRFDQIRREQKRLRELSPEANVKLIRARIIPR